MHPQAGLLERGAPQHYRVFFVEALGMDLVFVTMDRRKCIDKGKTAVSSFQKRKDMGKASQQDTVSSTVLHRTGNQQMSHARYIPAQFLGFHTACLAGPKQVSFESSTIVRDPCWNCRLIKVVDSRAPHHEITPQPPQFP